MTETRKLIAAAIWNNTPIENGGDLDRAVESVVNKLAAADRLTDPQELERLRAELADARAEIAHLRREDVIGHLRVQLDEARAKADQLRESLNLVESVANDLRARMAYLENEVTEEASSAAGLRQTLDATRQQLRDEAKRIMRHPAHPPVAADIAWQLRQIAEPEPRGRWVLPAEPGPETTQVWDRDGGQWCRLNQPQATGEGWVPADTLRDEVHVTEAAIHWDQLVYEYGPLSATPPETAPECDECGGSGVVEDAGTWGDRTSTCRVCKGGGQAATPETANSAVASHGLATPPETAGGGH